MSDCGIPLLSLGSDGAANELAAQKSITLDAPGYLCFEKKLLDVEVRVPLLGNPPRPIVPVQDPKHARKTAANQILSGARLLSFGRYHINIQQLASLLDVQPSPLVVRDVLDCDKQDDGRAYRTFNSKTLEAALDSEDCQGLAIYLFVCGEMCDAWLHNSIGHRARIWSAWTAIFFLRIWRNYILEREQEPQSFMSLKNNFISHQSFRIFDSLGESLIGLILSHRDYYPDIPLLPWKHGTEACEHIFGWMRVISPNFTILDARQMMPKIYSVVKSVMSGKVKLAPSAHMHSGQLSHLLRHLCSISQSF